MRTDEGDYTAGLTCSFVGRGRCDRSPGTGSPVLLSRLMRGLPALLTLGSVRLRLLNLEKKTHHDWHLGQRDLRWHNSHGQQRRRRSWNHHGAARGRWGRQLLAVVAGSATV